jgi:hypothetical protein
MPGMPLETGLGGSALVMHAQTCQHWMDAVATYVYIRVGARLAIGARTRQGGARPRWANRQPTHCRRSDALPSMLAARRSPLDIVRTHPPIRCPTHTPVAGAPLHASSAWLQRAIHTRPAAPEPSNCLREHHRCAERSSPWRPPQTNFPPRPSTATGHPDAS